MAKAWHVETDASEAQIVAVAKEVFFVPPPMAARFKVWSKAAVLQSNIRWTPKTVPGSVLAAEVVSGGVREAIASSKNGGGSMLGTTIAVGIEEAGGGRRVTLWLESYNTYFGINQQGDLLKSYAKQIATGLIEQGVSAEAHK